MALEIDFFETLLHSDFKFFEPLLNRALEFTIINNDEFVELNLLVKMRIEANNFAFVELERFDVFKEPCDLVLDEFGCFGACDDLDQIGIRHKEEAGEVLTFFVQLHVHSLRNLVKCVVACCEHFLEIFGVNVRRNLFIRVGLTHPLYPLFILLFEFGSFGTKLFLDVLIAENRFQVDP